MIVKEKGFISKEKFCKICQISKNTAYKLIEFERIKAIKRNCGSSYYYEIPVSEIARLGHVRSNINKLKKEEIRKVKRFYSEKLSSYPDGITSDDVQIITGYCKTTVRSWITSGKISGVISNRKFVMAKNDFLDFITTPYYVGIAKKSKEHLADFVELGIVNEKGQRI